VAILDVDGSSFTKEITGYDLLKHLVEHFNLPLDEAKNKMAQGLTSLYVRSNPTVEHNNPPDPVELYLLPLTREQVELLTEAVDDALPLWKQYGKTDRWMKLLQTANFLSEHISGKEEW
jgi:hypothetical protein